MITETEQEIIDEFYKRGIKKEDNLGFMCVLNKKNAHKEMLQWLKANSNARYDEILDKIAEIYDRD